MYDECNIIEIKDPSLLVDIRQPLSTLVEVQRNDLLVQILECEDQPGAVIGEPEIELCIFEDIIEHVEIKVPTIEVNFPDHVSIVNNYGAPGVQDDARTIVREYEAASQINVNRVVALRPDGRIEHADKDTPPHFGLVFGVSRQSGTTGTLVEIVSYGSMAGASLSGVGDILYLGNNGLLTISPTASGTWQSIGEQHAASTFFVNISEPIRRI